MRLLEFTLYSVNCFERFLSRRENRLTNDFPEEFHSYGYFSKKQQVCSVKIKHLISFRDGLVFACRLYCLFIVLCLDSLLMFFHKAA